MRPRKFLPLSLILLPLLALASINCGIIALPVEGPKVLIANAKHLKFSVDIVDANGEPLDDVTISVTRHAYSPDLFFVETDDRKQDPPRVINGKFEYETFGKVAVEVRYEKQGYQNHECLYGEEDKIELPNLVFGWYPRPAEIVNIKKNPQSRVVLTKTSSTQPRSEWHLGLDSGRHAP